MNFTTYALKSKDRVLLISKPIIMGILNVTPDSFFERSRIAKDKIVDTAGLMLQNGASILDIGGQSTRPGAEQIEAETESQRVIPAILALRSAFPDCWISIDTYNTAVAKNAVNCGADIVNDISAGDYDAEMLPFIAENKIPYVAMHKQGNPQTMQKNPDYRNVTDEVISYFNRKQKLFQSIGIDNWIVDPGFGFGKTIEHNFQLLRELQQFRILEKPILIGISRKSMIWKKLQTSVENALNGTTALHMIALMHGADILRVHDVKEAHECVTLYHALHVK